MNLLGAPRHILYLLDWDKVADMTGILSEMSTDRLIEVGLKLREAKVFNGISNNNEAWSNLANEDMASFEQVNMQ